MSATSTCYHDTIHQKAWDKCARTFPWYSSQTFPYNILRFIKKTKFSHKWHLDCQTIICALARKCLKMITFTLVVWHTKYVTACFQAWTASQHSSIYNGMGIKCSLMYNQGIHGLEASSTQYVNLLTMQPTAGEKKPSIYCKQPVSQPSLDCALNEGHLTAQTDSNKWSTLLK
jgi:hypothetical protein